MIELLLWVRRFEFLNPQPSISHLKPSFSKDAENQEISFFQYLNNLGMLEEDAKIQLLLIFFCFGGIHPVFIE